MCPLHDQTADCRLKMIRWYRAADVRMLDRVGSVGLRVAVLVLAVSVCASCRTARPDSGPAIVQPGAPGEAARVISPETAVDLSRVDYTPADVRFMQGMIGHHAQAIEMVALLRSRTARDDMRLLARRIELSQEDEIALMQH